jgi:hypothetical protein
MELLPISFLSLFQSLGCVDLVERIASIDLERGVRLALKRRGPADFFFF